MELLVYILMNLDSTRATGCDEISMTFMKAYPLAMARLLTKVIEKVYHHVHFLGTGKIPALFLLQFQNLGIMTNFYSKSFLPVFSETLEERVIHNPSV